MNDRPADSDELPDDEDRSAIDVDRAAARRELAGDLASLAANAAVGATCVGVFWSTNGERGLLASGIGAATCVVGSALSLIPARYVDRPLKPLVRSVAGLLLRAGLPLGVILWAKLTRPELMNAGLLTTVVAAYVAGWVVEAGWRMSARNVVLREAESGERRGPNKFRTVL